MIDIVTLKDGQRVVGKFAVRTKEAPRTYKNKEGMYFVLEVGNRTGDIVLKYWGGPDTEKIRTIYSAINVGDVIGVEGMASYDRYRNTMTIVVDEAVHRIRKCDESEYVPEDYIKTTDKDVEKMMDELLSVIQTVNDEDYRRLLTSIFSDSGFVSEFKMSPSAMTHHHNYLGGLVEHTLNVVRICQTLCDIYTELDRDLLTTAAILHDLGKTRSYICRTSIMPSDEGRLLSHTVISYSIVKEHCRTLQIPQKKRDLLFHAILSHHGPADDRTLVNVKTAEACALHYADKLDAYVKDFLQAKEREAEDEWTYDRVLRKEIYVGKDE